jgi:ubiquinone/menaquinone biosynthesis C-methylase UbiE
MRSVKPAIVDKSAEKEFLEKIVAANLDPNDRWVREYVSLAWERARPFFAEKNLPRTGSKALEFGCNIGATSIMLAALGAKVTAIDVNRKYVDIAQANAKAHGVAEKIEFRHVCDTRQLPFEDSCFELVVCNSVLEYVHADHLAQVLREIDRVLKRGGVLFVLGTSSRLWPREVHSGAWLVNYLPRVLDPLIRSVCPHFMRGLNPSRLLQRFDGYENLDRTDGGRSLLAARERMAPGWKLAMLRLANGIAIRTGLSLGLLLPSFTVALRKPPA